MLWTVGHVSKALMRGGLTLWGKSLFRGGFNSSKQDASLKVICNNRPSWLWWPCVGKLQVSLAGACHHVTAYGLLLAKVVSEPELIHTICCVTRRAMKMMSKQAPRNAKAGGLGCSATIAMAPAHCYHPQSTTFATGARQTE